MSTEAVGGEQLDRQATEARPTWLGVLLKHAHLGFAEQAAAALAPHRIDGRELAVLVTLGSSDLLVQQEVAQRLGIDRTTMVALIDGLEAKGLVARNPHPDDRRKKVVAMTRSGQATLARASAAAEAAERRFLEPLGTPGAEQFKEALRSLLR